MTAIYKRELRSYFTTPLGYVFLGIYMAVSAAVFCFTTLFAMTTDVTNYFSTMLSCMTILLPLLTMKLFTEEKKQRTEQLLLTAPVSVFSIALAKFLAAFTMFAGATLVSGLYFLILIPFGNVKAGILLGNIIAMLLIGMAFIAIGLFVSSVTESQLSAAIVTIVILLGLMSLSIIGKSLDVYAIRFIVESLSIFYRFQNFSHGILDFTSLFYYLSIAALFLFLTVRVLDRRRWR